MKRKFITSALPYVNNQPHLGNVIGCVLSADVYARYCKNYNQTAVHICGTDEYGTATEMSAISQNCTPAELCAENRILHKKVYDWFNIQFDYFGSTSSPEHTELVQELFVEMYNNKYFTEEVTEQLYCGKCQLFLADRFVVGICKFCKDDGARGDQCDACGQVYKSIELEMPKCVLCNSTPSIKETKHLFFRLDKFKKKLCEFYEANSRNWSLNARNIFNQWMNMDLHSRCMTRDLKYKWGVPVPLPGYEEKVFYVWFDAPIGYFTFLKSYFSQKHSSGELSKDFDEEHGLESRNKPIERFDEFLNGCELFQFMGKDNVAFHTVIFPSMLMATNKTYPLVSHLSATEYLLFEGRKFSKSRKHGIFGLDLIDNKLGSSCVWRYYLLKIRPETKDSNFTFSDFQLSVTADLINNVGNFCNRVLKYIKTKLNRQVRVSSLTERDLLLQKQFCNMHMEYRSLLDKLKIKDALLTALNVSKLGNEYVQSSIKGDRAHGFSVAFSVVVFLGFLLDPFIPETAFKIREMCLFEGASGFVIIENHTIAESIVPLFKPFTEEQKKEFEKYVN